MAYNEILANRIREKLEDFPNVTGKEMMGGLTLDFNSRAKSSRKKKS